jgi:acetyl-CoA synthetase
LPKTISGKIRRVDLRAGEQMRKPEIACNANEWWDLDFPDLSPPLTAEGANSR